MNYIYYAKRSWELVLVMANQKKLKKNGYSMQHLLKMQCILHKIILTGARLQDQDMELVHVFHHVLIMQTNMQDQQAV